MTTAILAYGSLITDPGAELAAVIRETVTDVRTPFRIEYGRVSSRRAGAPTLCPVEVGGCRVTGQLLVLDDAVSQPDAYDMLFRREMNVVGDVSRSYDSAVARIERYEDAGRVVLYAALPATLPQIQDGELTDGAKARLLAERAVASVTAETYASGRDGIAYLRDALAVSIVTPLSAAYRGAVLTLTGASSLDEARGKR